MLGTRFLRDPALHLVGTALKNCYRVIRVRTR